MPNYQAQLARNRDWVLAKVAQDNPLDCGTCTACCRRTAPMLYPEAGDDPNRYLTTEVFDPYWGGPRHMLVHREDGACIYLDDEKGCRIHDHRPRTCRAYSCLIQFNLLTRAERRLLQREGKWTPIHEAGEKQAERARAQRLGSSEH